MGPDVTLLLSVTVFVASSVDTHRLAGRAVALASVADRYRLVVFFFIVFFFAVGAQASVGGRAWGPECRVSGSFRPSALGLVVCRTQVPT